MDRNTSDSEQNATRYPESPTLTTRRKRKKTKGERDQLHNKSRKHNSKQFQAEKKAKKHEKYPRKILKQAAVPMIKQNVPTITNNRLTRRFGLFDKMKASETVIRDITMRQTTEDLHKILDLEDSGIQKAVDIRRLNPKRTKVTTIRASTKAIDLEPKNLDNKKSASTKTLYTVSSDSSVEVRDDVVMEVDEDTSPEPKLPTEPDYPHITETVRNVLRSKNQFGDRDLVQEIRSRLRTLYRASSPSPSAVTTPQQRIPATRGSFSSETVKRDSSQDKIEISLSDSETQTSYRGSSRKLKPSSGSRRITTKPKDKPHEELPITYTIPRITVDALSDAKQLLRLNDNVLSHKTEKSMREAEMGYIESRMKAHEIRRALAPVTNVITNHPSVNYARTRVLPTSDICQNSNAYDMSEISTSFPNFAVNNNLNRSTFRPPSHNDRIIASNQNAIAQYVYPINFEQHRHGTRDAPLYFGDPVYSYPSMSMSSQETFKSTDTLRSRPQHETRYRAIDDVLTGQGNCKMYGDPMDLLDAADVPPSDPIIRSPPTRRRHQKPKSPTPSPPIIYPFRLYSKSDI